MQLKVLQSKKIPTWAVVLALYLSLCFTGFYSSRGSLALFYNEVGIDNAVLAFFSGGLLPLVIYEILTRMVFRTLSNKTSTAFDLHYILRFFYLAASIVAGLIKLIYFINPLFSVYGEIFIDFIVCLVFFILYYLFICKNYLKKQDYAIVLYSLAPLFLGVWVLVSIISVLGGI